MQMTQPRALAVGDVFVNHRIEAIAGRGGMGVVYRAIDRDLDRTVALKVISPALAERADFRSRFVAESKAAASIEHPNVIPVYYAGEREGVLFIVMRYVDGLDLQALVRACGRLDPMRAVRIVAQVADALDAAHERGLVHRDVKPANILLGAGDHAYLTDFGLTKRAAANGRPAIRGGWAGTPGYLAPEQILGEHVDGRADVYALGCVLVHAVTGAAPYVCDGDKATLRAHLSAPVPVDRVPPQLAGVVGRALAKDPSERFETAGELGRAALAAVGAAPRLEPVARRRAMPRAVPDADPAPAHLGETHPSPPSRVARRPVRWRAVATAAMLLALGALTFAFAAPLGEPVRAGTALAETPALHIAARPVRVGAKPDAVATAGGRAWVLSSATGQIDVLDVNTGRPQGRIDLGKSASGAAMAAGFGAVWAIKASTRSLIRIGAGRHRHVDTAIAIDAGGSPDRIAIGATAVWVAARDRAGGAESIVRVDPQTFAQRRIAVPAGTRHIAAGQGGVWVTNARLRTVTRIDAQDLSVRTIDVGVAPDAIAVTRRAVWVASGSALVRVNPRTGSRRTVVLDAPATRILVAGGSVWAIAASGRTVIRIDPATLRVRDTIATPASAGAIAASGRRALWLALSGSDSAQRIAFRP